MVKNIEVNTKSKELTEARVGSMIFVEEGISREIEKEIQGEKGSRKVKPFIVVREGKSKYGNEIKEVGGVRGGGGIVKVIEKLGREMVLGAYVEYGDGKYRSKEEIGGEVNSRGKSNYVGIGMKGEVEIKERIYGQVGMRIGKYASDFESEDMGVGSKEGEEMKYDIEGMYAGVEVGGRCKVVEKKKIGVEVKGEIGMMSMGGKEVKLTSGNKVDFKGVKIGKVRMEVKGEYEVKEKIKPYVGLGCEYDKMWDVEARSGNLEIPSSHIEGVSGIGEMGVEVEMGRIGIRCGCECYVGERKGIDGMLKVRYAI
jgi:outer membrane autotransporter protein